MSFFFSKGQLSVEITTWNVVEALFFFALGLVARVIIRELWDYRHLVLPGRPSTHTSAPTPKAASHRPYGQWQPVAFTRPTVPADPSFSVTDTKPLPYRPFKWGAYHITMGLRSMPWPSWIELDRNFLPWHAVRAARLRDRGQLVCRTAPAAYPAAFELLEELADFLPQRYPSLYRRTSGSSVLENLATGERFDVAARPLPEDPMATAARMVQEDLAIMIEGDDGQYYLLAGAILMAGFWRLQDKFGLPLAAIHSAGRGVPGFESKLKRGMESFFRRITPEKPMQRLNYSFQVDDGLAWSTSLGSEDGEKEGSFGWHQAEKDKVVESHYFRTERQTLRRLPKTGGVVFTIKIVLEKVTDIAEEPGVPGRLASAVRGWDEDVSSYKGKEWYGDILLEYLDMKHQEQKDKGLIDGVEEHADYPF